jgi:glycosyltransferase involved in cell wall biosynthesis
LTYGGHYDIKILDKVLDSEEIKALYVAADCYVSLHRSEGFGLTMAEAMALGKPVIATAYSGNMDFMTPSNSYLVKYSLTEIDRDYGPYKKGMVWAEPDIDDAARLMRYVYENQDEARRVGAIAATYIKEHFSPESVGKMYAARIDYILRYRCPDIERSKFLNASRS